MLGQCWWWRRCSGAAAYGDIERRPVEFDQPEIIHAAPEDDGACAAHAETVIQASTLVTSFPAPAIVTASRAW